MSLQELHERLLSWASAPPMDQELLKAKREHFERYGEPHEEDRSYELRLNGMLDAYLYDYKPTGGFGTTLERFVDAAGPSLAAEEVAAFRALGQAILAEVKKLRKAVPRGIGADPKPFLARLSRMALKLERYRNVRLESIYDFSPDARTWTPAPRAKTGPGE